MYNILKVRDYQNYTRTKPEEDRALEVKGEVVSKSTNIYYNLSIVNRVIEDPAGILPSISVPKLAEFQVNRANSIITKPSDYRVAVNRFACPTGLIPLFLFPENESYYTISLTYNDGVNPITQITKNIVYIPSAVGDPYANQGLQPVYYIQELINYVNVAYQEAYDDMKTALGATYLPEDRPYLTYDATTRLITMWCQEEYLDFSTNGIFMNTTLFLDFFSGLYAREASTNILGQFSAYQIIPQNLLTNVDLNLALPDGTPSTFYRVVEEFSSAPLFNQLDRLVLTTSRLPIDTQLLGTQVDERANILLDFILPDNQGTKQKYEYEPKILNWTDMKSNTPLTNVDLKVYLVYNDGKILPLYISGSQRIDITLKFVPKGCIYQ